MKTLYSRMLWGAVIALCCTGVHAELYKSVGPDGKVTYSDVPPPKGANARQSVVPVGGGSSVGLPYELAEAVKNGPVTLYTAPACPPCDEGRKMLTDRGIPFSEKTVVSTNDFAQLKQAGSADGKLPLLKVGRQGIQGYEMQSWNSALDASGYPANSRLPAGYRNPPAQSAAPESPGKQAAEGNDAKAPRDTGAAIDNPRPASGNAPPGFRF